MRSRALFGRKVVCMYRIFSYLSMARALGIVACVAVIWLNFFGSEEWHLWVVHVYGLDGMILLLFVPHLLLPLLPPSRRALTLFVVLYTLFWSFMWFQYREGVAADPMNADSRGTTGGLFIWSNLAFAAGLLLRLALFACLAFIRRLNAKRGEHAV